MTSYIDDWPGPSDHFLINNFSSEQMYVKQDIFNVLSILFLRKL